MNILFNILNNLEPGEQVGLACSGIAITVSIVVGLLNYFNTKRQFRAAYYPHIQMSLKDKECETGVCPHLHISNLSKDKSIINANIRLLIRNPTWFPPFSHPLWIKMVSQDRVDIKPEGEFILADSSGKEFKSLEQFMVASFPKYIRAEPVGKSQFRYYLAHTRPLTLHAVIYYESSITGAGRWSIRRNFKVQPVSAQQTGQGHRLSYWKF